jgi:hypothetical protein
MFKKIISLIFIIIFSTIIGFSSTLSTNLSFKLMADTDDTYTVIDCVNDNFNLVDDLFDNVSTTEFGYLDGVTSAIQTQLGLRYLKTQIDTLPEMETIWALDVTTSTELATALTSYYLKTAIDTQGEVETIWGVTLATDTELSLKANIASPTFTGTVTIPTPFTLGAVSVTATGTELNYVAGVTSAIQTQLGLRYLKTEIDTEAEMETIWGVGLAHSGANSDITSMTGLTTALGLAYGGTGQTTAQLAINALTAVAAATNEYVLTKDTTTGNAIFKVAASGGVPTTITVANEATDTSCFPLFVTAATGDLGPKTVAGLSFNSNTGVLTATGFSGPLTGNVTGNTSGSAGSCTGNAATVTGFTPASGSLTLAGADALTLTTSADTNITLPTTGTLLANTVEDTTPELGGELDAGAHSIGFTQQTATGDGTTTIDWKLGNKFKFTFGAQNETFTFTEPSNPCTLMLTLIQDATGSRTVTWPATVKWPGGTAPTLTTTANARDKIALDWDGTQYDGMSGLDFK